MPAALQVLGLATVVVTAVGCLYFMDPTPGVAHSNVGKNVAGVLILLLNALFVVVMAVIKFRAAKHEYHAPITWCTQKIGSLWQACLAVMSWQPRWSIKRLKEVFPGVQGRDDSSAAVQRDQQLELRNSRRDRLTLLIEPELRRSGP